MDKLRRDIETGRAGGLQIEQRTAAYALGVRPAYYGLATVAEMAGDATLCRRVINSKEGCVECSEVASYEFIPIEEMPEIGSLVCGVWCLCEVEFK